MSSERICARAAPRPRLTIWPPRRTDPNIDREIEQRLVRKHGRGQSSVYGSLRSVCGRVQAIDVTIWPLDSNPTDPGARRHISGHWVKVELVGSNTP